MKTVMVDFDDTLVSFSEMFVNRINSYISKNKYFPYDRRLKIEDIQNYDFYQGFKTLLDGSRLDSKYLYNLYCNYIFDDEHFYDNAIFTPEYFSIMKIIQDYKNRDYKIILNTKCSSTQMIRSKANFIDSNEDFKIFDEFIIDMEKGAHMPKNTHYNVMIDDAPHNIENYIKENPQGLLYMPLRPWNKQFMDKIMVNVIDR